jgi:RHS repeat-associated protein
MTLFSYLDNPHDRRLQRIVNTHGATLISEFRYEYDIAAWRITIMSHTSANQTPVLYSLAYDAADQLTTISGSQNGNVVKNVAYSYDNAGNRLTEQIDGVTQHFSYNALNQLTAAELGSEIPATYQWDAANRLVSVLANKRLTQIDYDGFGRMVGLRQLNDGVQVSDRRFIWCDSEICEERNSAGAVVKRFAAQGTKVETGATAGKYFYTRDLLGSVYELVDDAGSVRARFDYDAYGSRTRIAGDLEGDFGFSGHLYDPTTTLCLATHRAYNSDLGRWLSRDPLPNVEKRDSNLYLYVSNDPTNSVDPEGTQAGPGPGPLPGPGPGPTPGPGSSPGPSPIPTPILPPAPGDPHPTGPTIPVPGPTSPTIPVPPNPAPDKPVPPNPNPQNPSIPRPPKTPGDTPDWVWLTIIICGVVVVVVVATGGAGAPLLAAAAL